MYDEFSLEPARLKEHRKKRGRLCYLSNRMVLTFTARFIQKKVSEKGLTVSLRKVRFH